MTMNSYARPIFATLVATLVGTASLDAARLEAPSIYMRHDRYRSAVVKVAEIQEDGRFRLQVLEPLFGETPDGLVVRAVGGAGDSIEAGGTYIIGHTDKPARRSRRWDTDPDGSRILNVPSVGLGVFENSPAMRTLVRAHPADSPLGDRQRLDAVIEQLASADIQSRRFVLSELVLAPEIRALVGGPELEVLRATLSSGELEPMAHDYLLRAARTMIGDWGGDWLAVDCRQLLASHGIELDQRSLIPSLLVTALEILGETGEAADARLAGKHVPSNNPGVGKAAFAAMMALDSDLAVEAAPGYIADDSIHLDTRRYVQQALNRAQLDRGQ